MPLHGSELSSDSEVLGDHSNHTNSEETLISSHQSGTLKVERNDRECPHLLKLSSKIAGAIFGSDENPTSDTNGEITLNRNPEARAESYSIQVKIESFHDEVSQMNMNIQMSGLAPTSSIYVPVMALTAYAHQGNAIAQMRGSDKRSLIEDLEFWSAFALWAGGISFAGMIAIIGTLAGLPSTNTKMNSMNVGVVGLACIFSLSLLFMALTKCLPAHRLRAAAIKILSALIIVLFGLVTIFMLSLVL